MNEGEFWQIERERRPSVKKRITVLDKGIKKEEIGGPTCCPVGPTKV